LIKALYLRLEIAGLILICCTVVYGPTQVVHTHFPQSPSSIIWYCSVNWGVNRHTVWHRGPVCMVLQLWPVFSCGPWNQRSALPCGMRKTALILYGGFVIPVTNIIWFQNSHLIDTSSWFESEF